MRFFSEIQHGDLHGKNSQQDAGTLSNKAPLLRDMKKWTPRDENLNSQFPKTKVNTASANKELSCSYSTRISITCIKNTCHSTLASPIQTSLHN